MVQEGLCASRWGSLVVARPSSVVVESPGCRRGFRVSSFRARSPGRETAPLRGSAQICRHEVTLPAHSRQTRTREGHRARCTPACRRRCRAPCRRPRSPPPHPNTRSVLTAEANFHRRSGLRGEMRAHHCGTGSVRSLGRGRLRRLDRVDAARLEGVRRGVGNHGVLPVPTHDGVRLPGFHADGWIRPSIRVRNEQTRHGVKPGEGFDATARTGALVPRENRHPLSPVRGGHACDLNAQQDTLTGVLWACPEGRRSASGVAEPSNPARATLDFSMVT